MVATPKLTIFISYVHEDVEIAGAVNNLLQDGFGSDVAVFIDKVSIQHGADIHTSIDLNLKKADMLAIVSTGLEGPRYWAGYEIGFFLASHDGPAPEGHPLWGRFVAFCSGNPPGPVAGDKYVPLGFDKLELEMNQEEFNRELAIPDDEPLLLWCGELYQAVQGKCLTQYRGELDRFRSIVKEFRTKVFLEFKRRPKSEFKPQKKLTIHFTARRDYGLQINDDAEVKLAGYASSVFGIVSQSDSQTLKWGEFYQELVKSDSSLADFWVGTLIRLLDKAKTGGLEEISGNLIWSSNEQKLFRLLLTALTTYYDGSVEANIYLVPVLGRKDGDRLTTLISKSLQAALRFRSLFIEGGSPFNYLNIEYGKDSLYKIAADIATEIDYLNMDLIEADIHNPSSYREILSEKAIESMAQTWMPLKERLLRNCRRAMTEAADIEASKSELVSTLREISATMEPINDQFLNAVAEKLKDATAEAERKRGANLAEGNNEVSPMARKMGND